MTIHLRVPAPDLDTLAGYLHDALESADPVLPENFHEALDEYRATHPRRWRRLNEVPALAKLFAAIERDNFVAPFVDQIL